MDFVRRVTGRETLTSFLLSAAAVSVMLAAFLSSPIASGAVVFMGVIVAFSVGTIIDRHIMRETLAPFLFGVAAFSVMLIAGEMMSKLIKLVVEHNAPAGKVLELFVLRLPKLVTLSFPIAMLLASIMAVGRLSHDGEITALLSGGVSFHRLMLPILLISSAVSALTLVCNRSLSPVADRTGDRLMHDLRGYLPPVTEFVMLDPPFGKLEQVVVAQWFDPRGGELRDVTVISYIDGRPSWLLHAKQAVWKEHTEWTFRDGFTRTLLDERARRLTFEVFTRDISKTLVDVEMGALTSLEPTKLTTHEIKEILRSLESRAGPVEGVNSYLVELHVRSAFALACVLLVFVGAPLGFRGRRSGVGIALGVSLVITLAYYAMMHYCRIMGRAGMLPPWLAGWSANIVVLVVGGILTLKAKR